MKHKMPSLSVVFDREYRIDLEREVSIGIRNLPGEILAQPTKQIRIGTLAAWAAIRSERTRMKIDSRLAKLDRAVRERFEKDGEKVTERRVEGEVHRDPRLRRLRKEWLRARETEMVLRNALDTLRHRNDLLVLLSDLSRPGGENRNGKSERRAAAAGKGTFNGSRVGV